MKFLLFLAALLLFPPLLMAQANLQSRYSVNGFQYGFSLKTTVFFDFQHHRPNPHFRIGADVGVASTFLDDWLYPAMNLELQLYNGGFGTRNRSGHNYGANFEILPAFTLTAGCGNHFKDKASSNRYTNLYYFSNYARPALQNPYDHSISIGTVFCIVTDTAKRSQRIGFLGLNFAAGAQLTYYNDGAVPFKQLALGDGYDRYQTGGGMISYNGPLNTWLNNIELAYHKYTGYSFNTFEASNKLFLAFMDYQQPEQKQFNRSLFDLSISNPNKGYGLNIQWYNSVSADLQHDIHTGVLDTYHMVPYTPPYIAIGFNYYKSYQQTGLK